jgi:hypothetical protein
MAFSTPAGREPFLAVVMAPAGWTVMHRAIAWSVLALVEGFHAKTLHVSASRHAFVPFREASRTSASSVSARVSSIELRVGHVI